MISIYIGLKKEFGERKTLGPAWTFTHFNMFIFPVHQAT